MSVEKRNLCLSSFDINPSTNATDYSIADVTTSVGTIGQYFNYMTWRNVDLKTSLGESYYNKYNKFSIKLIECFVGNLTYTDISSNIEQSVLFQLTGDLPFKNYNATPYNLTNINSTNKVTLYTGLLSKLPAMTTLSSTVSGTKISIEDPLTYIFTKPTSDVITMSIEVVKLSGLEYLNTLGYGHFRFVFEISGL